MTHFGVRRREGFFAALTVGGSMEVFFLLFGERQHVNPLAKYIAYDLAFTHYVVVEFSHGVRPAVHERWSLVLHVLRHPIHAEAGHFVVVYDLGVAFSVVFRWRRERFKVTHEQKRNGVLFVARVELKRGVAFARIANLLRVISGTVRSVVVKSSFADKRMQARDADVRSTVVFASVGH